MTDRQRIGPLLGVLTADAAALGLHWLYDQPTLEQAIKQTGQLSPAFMPVDGNVYTAGSGYFAAAGKSAGDFSHYGEAVLFWLETRLLRQQTTLADWQAAFLEHFGPGGQFTGYLDRPTRHTVHRCLDAFMQRQSSNDSSSAPLEIDSAHPDDDQNPALNAVIAAVLCNQSVLPMAEVTHRHPDTLQYAAALQSILSQPHTASQPSEMAESLIEALPDTAKERWEKLKGLSPEPAVLAAAVSTACHLPDSVPLAAYVLMSTSSFEAAVELNIRLGGDSCGRALTLGALGGACYGLEGIPLSWLFRLKSHERVARILQHCRASG